MDTLSEEPWDLVIVGTGLPQALLALSLSRSNLKILHVDQHRYYGSEDAGLSLEETESWAAEQNANTTETFPVTISRTQDSNRLGPSRTYTLNLNPQIIYASNHFLACLVTSRLHNQLDFLAVGSSYVLSGTTLRKIPSSREDVFADESLSRRDKIGLMKLLRYVLQEPDGEADPEAEVQAATTVKDALEARFKIPPSLHGPVSSLALATKPADSMDFDTAVSRIRRHLKSVNYFGPGFAAVYPKYAGNTEIAQVACRAGAVGGAVYLLGQGVSTIETQQVREEFVSLTLSNGTTVKTRKVIGTAAELPQLALQSLRRDSRSTVRQIRSVTVVSGALSHLFEQTAENGPVPAVAIVLVEDNSVSKGPIYLQVHSEDTGECPSGQCCIYASTILAADDDDKAAQLRLESALVNLLRAEALSSESADGEVAGAANIPRILWSMTYASSGVVPDAGSDESFAKGVADQVICLPHRVQDIALDDGVLATVKAVWRSIIGNQVEDDQFLVFEDRNPDGD